MATFTVITPQNYTAINGGSVADFDRITVTQGARLTINTDTAKIERLHCVTLGEVLVENTSPTTPIFVRFGEDGATANAQIRFEAGGAFRVRGNWITLGTGDGTAGQSHTLPQNAAAENIEILPAVFITNPGDTEPTIYTRVDSFTDCFGEEKLGTVFIHDTANNQIIFGDGENGHMPVTGSLIRIPNIHFFDGTTGTGYTDWDLATSGKVDMDICSWGANFAHNYSSASSVTVKNAGFDLAREDMNCGSQQSPYFKNVGILMQNDSHYMNLSAANNFTIENVMIYNTVTANEYHGFYPVNASGGSFTGCRVVAPDIITSTSRSAFYMTSPNLVFKDCYVATNAVGWIFGAGSGNTKITDCGFNGAGKKNATSYATYMLQSANSSGNVIQRLNSYPLLPSEGAVAANTYSLSLSTGTANFTIDDCDIYVGENGNPARTNNPLFFNGVNHRVNNIRIHGDFAGDTVNHSTAAANIQISNVRFMNPETNGSDMEWTDGCSYELVATPDNIDTAPSASGKDAGTFSLYVSNDNTAVRIYKPMGSHTAGSDKYAEISVTGNVLFNNAGAMYMDTAGDIVEFYSDVHGGITAFTGFALRGSSTANFTVEFALRNPGGTYGALQTLSTANLQAALAALTGYDSNVGLQIKYRITRTHSNVTNYLNHIDIRATVDAAYQAPFDVFPTEGTFTGLTAGDVIYIEDANNNQKMFKTAADDSDIKITLPNANDGETWGYVIKRAGFEHQKGSINVQTGVDVTVNVSLAQKVQPVGGEMYTGSNNASITVDIDLATPQMNIDIGNATVSAQNLLDAVENALITNQGMKWLAQQDTDINFANLGGAGSFLFFENYIRVRRLNAAAENAEVSAYVFSTDGSSTDETNGTVKLFSGTIVNDFLESQLQLGNGTSMGLGMLFQVLASMVELDAQGTPHYRFNGPALENVWDALKASHQGAGTMGEVVQETNLSAKRAGAQRLA